MIATYRGKEQDGSHVVTVAKKQYKLVPGGKIIRFIPITKMWITVDERGSAADLVRKCVQPHLEVAS